METAAIITAIAALVSAVAGLFGGVKLGAARERKAQEMRVLDERRRRGPVEGTVEIGTVRVHVQGHNPRSVEAITRMMESLDGRSLPT